jgi:hypothetical protein
MPPDVTQSASDIHIIRNQVRLEQGRQQDQCKMKHKIILSVLLLVACESECHMQRQNFFSGLLSGAQDVISGLTQGALNLGNLGNRPGQNKPNYQNQGGYTTEPETVVVVLEEGQQDNQSDNPQQNHGYGNYNNYNQQNMNKPGYGYGSHHHHHHHHHRPYQHNRPGYNNGYNNYNNYNDPSEYGSGNYNDNTQNPGYQNPDYDGNNAGQLNPNYNGYKPGYQNPNYNGNKPGYQNPNYNGNKPGYQNPNYNGNKPGYQNPNYNGNKPGYQKPNNNGNNPGQLNPSYNGNNPGQLNPSYNGNNPGQLNPSYNENNPGQLNPSYNGNNPGELNPNYNGNEPSNPFSTGEPDNFADIFGTPKPTGNPFPSSPGSQYNQQTTKKPNLIPLNPNQYTYGGDNIDINAPKRETNENTKPAENGDDEAYPIDIRFGENETPM